MISAIKLLRNGSLETINIDDKENLDNLCTCINGGQTNIEELNIIVISNYYLKIFC